MRMGFDGKMPQAGVRRKRRLTTPAKIVIIVTAVLLVIVLTMVGLVVHKYAKIEGAQTKANQMYSPNSDAIPSGGEVVQDTPVTVDPATGVVSDFNKLYQKNADVVGHLSIPDTKLSTPVVQGSDNEYYLTHNFFKESTLGVPFTDYRATISQDYMSNNITMYGHSAKDGSYFALLKQYRTVDFYKQHPNIVFDTIYGRGKYKIIGAFIAKVSNGTSDASDDQDIFNYQEYINMTEDDFNTYISEIAKRTYFNTGVDVEYGDQLITLSTCDDQIDSSTKTPFRMVVVARKVRTGESTNVDTSVASANTSMIMPKAWIAKYKKDNPYK